MKKGLLLTLAIGTTLGVHAQNARIYNYNAKAVKATTKAVANDINHQGNYAPIKGVVNSPLMASSAVPLGTAPNAYSTTGAGRSFLWADPLLNAVTFSHRSTTNSAGTAAPTSGCVGFDVSTDGGATWLTNRGFVYKGVAPNLTDSSVARYPQGVVLNSSLTNTNPANAKFTYFAPLLDGTNAGSGGANWGGVGFGTANLDGTMANQKSLGAGTGAGKNGGFPIIPDDFFVTRQGTTWAIADNSPNIAGANQYNDTVLVWKGTTTAGVPSYQLTKLPVPAVKDGARGIMNALHIAFDETGQKGWIAFLTCLKDPTLFSQSDSATYPVLYKTVNGGATWTGPIAVIPATMQSVKDSLPSLNTANGEVGVYATSFELDLVVDKYGNPHMQTGIDVSIKANSAGPIAGYKAWSYAFQNGAQFALYSTDGGITFKSHKLANTKSFRGCFGDCPAGTNRIVEDPRGQSSISWDGQMVVHTWFDTDTTTAGTTENTAPNVHSVGLYLTNTTETWGAEKNLTPPGQAGNTEVIEGCVSYYLLPTSSLCAYNVPVAYSQLQSNDVTLPVQYQYLHNLEYKDSTICKLVGIKNLTSNAILASVTPNPTTGLATIAYSIANAASVTAEVYNVLGEKLATIANENQTAGTHNLTIDLSKYNNGLYVVRMNVNGINTTVKVVKN